MAIALPPIPNSPLTDTFIWREWFYNVSQALVQQASIAWTSLNFTGSNLTSIQTRKHNDLQGLQGGDPTGTQFYHLNQTQYNTIVALPSLGTMATQNANNVNITGGSITGITFPYTSITGLATVAHTGAYSDLTGTPTGLSVTITTAKLTLTGTQGSMTFTNGILTSQTQAT